MDVDPLYMTVGVVLLLVGIGAYIYRFEKGAVVRNDFKGPTPMPDVISLKQRGSPQWADKRTIEALTSQLGLRGFHDVGYYGIHEVPDVALQFWLKADENILAVVAEDIRRESTWLEMISFYLDTSDWWYTTGESDSSLSRKGSRRSYTGKIAPHQLYARLSQERSPAGVHPLTPENAQGLYERAYSEHRAFLKRKQEKAAAIALEVKTKGKVARK